MPAMLSTKDKGNPVLLPALDAVHDHITATLAGAGGDSFLAAVTHALIEDDLSGKRESPALPLLPLLTCELIGGDSPAAIPVAAAWNLLHLAAQIFDDLQDGEALEDRGLSLTPAQAMNAATALLFLAQLALAPPSENGEAPPFVWQQVHHELNQLGFQACIGQHRDLTEATGPAFTPQDYWQVAGAKSGSFFARACRAGALLGGGSAAQIAACDTYGYNLGTLLQITDDWVGLWPEEGSSDLARGKRTLAVLYALAVAPPAQREHLLALLGEARYNPQAEAEAREEIVQLGALEYTLVQAEVHRRRARSALDSFTPCPAREHLSSLPERIFPLLHCRRRPFDPNFAPSADAPSTAFRRGSEQGSRQAPMEALAI